MLPDFQSALPWLEKVPIFCSQHLKLTVATVELDRVGRQMDGDAVLVGLWEAEVLDLAVRAQHVYVQDCESADNKELAGTGTKGRRSI